MKFDLFSIGEMVIDFTPGRELGSYIRNPGGAPGNVAIAMARMGKGCAFCGKLGDDDFGHFLLETLEQNGVYAVCRDLTKEAVTTLVFVTVYRNGERSFTFARKPGADMLLTTSDVDIPCLQASTIVHAGSCSLSAGTAIDATEYAMKTAHELHKLVSFDVNYRNMLWENRMEDAKCGIRRVLPYVDLLKISDEELFLIGDEEALRKCMQQNGISLAVITYGEKGAKAIFQGKSLTVAGRTARVADTNGAGDAFWGAVLSSLLDTGIASIADITAEAVETALRYGNTAGWLAVQTSGAIPALPTREQVEAALI